MTEDAYAAARDSAARLAELSGRDRHDVAVVLGSGWAPAADALCSPAPGSPAPGSPAPGSPAPGSPAPGSPAPGGPGSRAHGPSATAPGATAPTASADPATRAPSLEFALTELGGFPRPTVAGHAGAARSVLIGDLRVLIYLGRAHLYEGLPVAAVTHGVRTAAAAGCKVIVLTNAAGGINTSYRVGQPVLISDHINLTGRSPLAGQEPPDGYGSRFMDLTEVYSARLRALAAQADPTLAHGVYAALPGPHYETPAEIRMLATAGADMVGMSTALEAIAARHLGLEVLGISLITNPAAGLTAAELDHADVIAVGRAAAARVGALLAQILPGVLT